MNEFIRKIAGIFTPHAVREMDRLREGNIRFAHYTSAESGLKILGSGQVLLRNSVLMNDFSEIQHGMSCLQRSYDGPLGGRLKSAIRQVQADLPEILEENFNSQVRDISNETYILSISEHGDKMEDQFGRLSMWRAYAAKNGIAFVFNNTPFLAETDAINAFTSPVVYETPETFERLFLEVVEALEGNIQFLQELGGQHVHDLLMLTLRNSVQSTKHPSFREEREWRVIFTPTLLALDAEKAKRQAERIPTSIMCINGVPQRVFSIPFENYPDEGFVGATVPELVDRILIGPTLDAYPIGHAFVHELNRLGVPDSASRVFVTGIPLRS